MSMTIEHLTAATQVASFPVSSLRDALKTSSAVQGLAILALIERAATLARDIDALRAAVAEDSAQSDSGLFWSDEFGACPLDDLLKVNGDDPEFCEWARGAAVGAMFHHQAGCVRRVA